MNESEQIKIGGVISLDGETIAIRNLQFIIEDEICTMKYEHEIIEESTSFLIRTKRKLFPNKFKERLSVAVSTALDKYYNNNKDKDSGN